MRAKDTKARAIDPDMECEWSGGGWEMMSTAAARQTKETLRMFRDSGGFDAFFPEDNTGHAAVLNEVPNLDTFDQDGFHKREIKTSLGNTLRLLSPLIILDEGQKAYSQL